MVEGDPNREGCVEPLGRFPIRRLEEPLAKGLPLLPCLAGRARSGT